MLCAIKHPSKCFIPLHYLHENIRELILSRRRLPNSKKQNKKVIIALSKLAEPDMYTLLQIPQNNQTFHTDFHLPSCYLKQKPSTFQQLLAPVAAENVEASMHCQ